MIKFTSISIRKDTRDLLRSIAQAERRSIAETVTILAEQKAKAASAGGA